MDKFKQVKAIGNLIGFNIDASGNETYNVQFPDMTIAELASYQFEEADAYHTNDRPRFLRNVLARLRELPEHDRKVWMDEIMHEFASDYGSVKYTLGYEQGKFDGAVEAEKSNTVVIPQFVAEWLEDCKGKKQSLYSALQDCDSVNNWLDIEGNEELFARAWLDGYEVEQEKRYKVKLKNTDDYLVKTNNDDYHFYNNIYIQNRKHTRKELEDAGFGWCFSCEGVEVQEVEE